MPQRRKKREAHSRALHVELVLLRLWVRWYRWQRCASVGGVGVAVADELVLQMLRRGASEARARTCVMGWRGDGEPSNGGMRTAEYERRRAQSGRGRKEDATRGRRQDLGGTLGLLGMLTLMVRATPCRCQQERCVDADVR